MRQTVDRGHRASGTGRAAVRVPVRPSKPDGSLQAANAKIETLERQLRHEQRLANLGMLALMVAHEYNNILTPIIGFAQLALTNPRFTEKALNHAVSGGEQAMEICDRLLGMKPGNGDKTDENARELVRDALVIMGRKPYKDGMELVVDVPEDLRLRTCRVDVQLVLLNLLRNARHALRSRGGAGRICVTARREASTVTLSVSDNGPGISPEHIDVIFEPFFTTKSTDATDDHSGHGLGLTFCRRVITDLGGEITVQSTVGNGATFVIRLSD